MQNFSLMILFYLKYSYEGILNRSNSKNDQISKQKNEKQVTFLLNKDQIEESEMVKCKTPEINNSNITESLCDLKSILDNFVSDKLNEINKFKIWFIENLEVNEIYKKYEDKCCAGKNVFAGICYDYFKYIKSQKSLTSKSKNINLKHYLEAHELLNTEEQNDCKEQKTDLTYVNSNLKKLSPRSEIIDDYEKDTYSCKLKHYLDKKGSINNEDDMRMNNEEEDFIRMFNALNLDDDKGQEKVSRKRKYPF